MGKTSSKRKDSYADAYASGVQLVETPRETCTIAKTTLSQFINERLAKSSGNFDLWVRKRPFSLRIYEIVGPNHHQKPSPDIG